MAPGKKSSPQSASGSIHDRSYFLSAAEEFLALLKKHTAPFVRLGGPRLFRSRSDQGTDLSDAAQRHGEAFGRFLQSDDPRPFLDAAWHALELLGFPRGDQRFFPGGVTDGEFFALESAVERARLQERAPIKDSSVPLTEDAHRVLTYLVGLPEGTGATAKEIAMKCGKPEIPVERIRDGIREELKPHGIDNPGGGKGYFIRAEKLDDARSFLGLADPNRPDI